MLQVSLNHESGAAGAMMIHCLGDSASLRGSREEKAEPFAFPCFVCVIARVEKAVQRDPARRHKPMTAPAHHRTFFKETGNTREESLYSPWSTELSEEHDSSREYRQATALLPK